jgi:hypothetical protein
LLYLWTDIVGIHLGEFYAWLPPVAAIVWMLWRDRRLIPTLPSRIRSLHVPVIGTRWLIEVTTLFVIALIFATRFWAIRTLEAPLWGDSYQHTLITQLILDHGGLFRSWQPYTEISSFSYHFGFHGLVAVFHWITHLPVQQSVLWVGQLLNALAVICLYPLATRLNQNHWGGIVTLFIAGLLLSMPMFYLNWGRYTQLAALVILPGIIYTVWDTLDQPTPSWRLIALSTIMLAGLGLTHYRVVVFIFAFLLTYFILNLKSRSFPVLLKKIVILSLGTFLLFLPWLINILSGELPQFLSSLISNSMKTPFRVNPAINLFMMLPPYIWITMFILVGWGLWRRNKSLATVSIWWLTIFLMANPGIFGLPSFGLDDFTVLISFFIPASLIIGESCSILTSWLETKYIYWIRNPRFSKLSIEYSLSIILTISIIGVSLWEARQRLLDIQPPLYALVTRPDLQAFQWIEANTDPNARFLVNSFLAYNNLAIVGSDGGWWLPLLAHRKTMLPPLNYGHEQGPTPDYQKWINSLVEAINLKGIGHPDVSQLLKERGIDYVYIGQRQGAVNSPSPLITPEQLLTIPLYQLIYNKDHVWVFKISSP